MTDFATAHALAGKLMGIYSSGHGTGHEGAYTWDEYMAAIHDQLGKSSKSDWRPVAAWLAAQLVGERALTHADTHFAMLQVARIVHDYEERRRIGPPENDNSHVTTSGGKEYRTPALDLDAKEDDGKA